MRAGDCSLYTRPLTRVLSPLSVCVPHAGERGGARCRPCRCAVAAARRGVAPDVYNARSARPNREHVTQSPECRDRPDPAHETRPAARAPRIHSPQIYTRCTRILRPTWSRGWNDGTGAQMLGTSESAQNTAENYGVMRCASASRQRNPNPATSETVPSTETTSIGAGVTRT